MGRGESIEKLEQWPKESKQNLKVIQRDSINFKTTELREEIQKLKGQTSSKAKKEMRRLQSLLYSEQRKMDITD